MKTMCNREGLLAGFGTVAGVVPARSPKPILQNVKLVADGDEGSTLLATERAEEVAGQLQYALDHRLVIERAVGYLMASRRLGAVEAFNTLRSAARSHRRKIGEVAAELLDSGSLPPGA